MRACVIVLLACGWLPIAAAPAQIEIHPLEATVGDRLDVQLTIEGDATRAPIRTPLGVEIGPFTVLSESWSEEAGAESPTRWVWTAQIAAYETGDLEFPSLTIPASDAGGDGWMTDAVAIRVVSVLDGVGEDGADGEVEIADLKAPAALAPNLKPIGLALGLLALFVVAALVAWWLHRKYGKRLEAAAIVADPFARVPPHEWAFSALRDLIEKKGSFATPDLFYAELAFILKRYLGGRYRLELLEQTTVAVQPLLEQAGAPTTAAARAGAVLVSCDAVKFAQQSSRETDQKEIVERVYGIVDQTKPSTPAQTGAA